MKVSTLKCVGYDTDFQKDLVAKNVPRPEEQPANQNSGTKTQKSPRGKRGGPSGPRDRKRKREEIESEEEEKGFEDDFDVVVSDSESEDEEVYRHEGTRSRSIEL